MVKISLCKIRKTRHSSIHQTHLFDISAPFIFFTYFYCSWFCCLLLLVTFFFNSVPKIVLWFFIRNDSIFDGDHGVRELEIRVIEVQGRWLFRKWLVTQTGRKKNKIKPGWLHQMHHLAKGVEILYKGIILIYHFLSVLLNSETG